MSVLGRILEKWVGSMMAGFIWLRIGRVANSFEHGNKILGSIKCWEIHDKLSYN
jgi:hypothetical protein